MTEIRFSERELDVMSALWRLGSGTVAEVRAEVPDALGYTSILKMLQILEEKGHVRHEEEGRAYRYFPTVAAEAAGDSALKRIVNSIFDGSAELLLARLVARQSLSAGELSRMRRMLEEAEAEASGREEAPAEPRGEGAPRPDPGVGP
jgi:BlaI family transcriptional regulator, penicillinase repressor